MRRAGNSVVGASPRVPVADLIAHAARSVSAPSDDDIVVDNAPTTWYSRARTDSKFRRCGTAMAYYLYSKNISHSGLGTFQTIRAPDPMTLEFRCQAKLAQWDRQWARQVDADAKRRARESARLDKEAMRRYVEECKGEAASRTAAAQSALDAIQGILAATISVNDRIDFEFLKDRSQFSEPVPPIPSPLDLPSEPEEDVTPVAHPPASGWHRFLEWFDTDFRKRRLKRQADCETEILQRRRREFDAAHEMWTADVHRRREARDVAVREWNRRVAVRDVRQAQFEAERKSKNDKIDDFADRYRRRDADAIERYCELVLERSSYPEWFPKDFSVAFDVEACRIVVEYVLPGPKVLPRLKAVKYVQSRDAFEETFVSDADAARLYDATIYQVTIRTLHELFESDDLGVVENVAFNGIVETTDDATGQSIRPCIVTVVATKTQILGLNLAQVDAKQCFRKLKGVSAAQLHLVTPVPPIVRLPTDDPRYVDSREVMSSLNEGVNLAAMDWQDFEHLVRQLCERRFAEAGAEVKVTQASRDGGVDAVILDPDPMRGGTIVVQAKRYTNVVSVSAVRDLFGTVQHEGAMKGILITTSSYGADSYEFAKGKPLTLVDGSNLLHLLGEAGTKAHIDIAAARKILRDEG